MKQSIFRRFHHMLLAHPIARWVVVLGAIVYLISPVDIVPDVIPIAGWIDDGVLATLVTTGITSIVLERRQQVRDQREKKG